MSTKATKAVKNISSRLKVSTPIYSTVSNTSLQHSRHDIFNTSLSLGLIYVSAVGLYVYYMSENNINYLEKEHRKLVDKVDTMELKISNLDQSSAKSGWCRSTEVAESQLRR